MRTPLKQIIAGNKANALHYVKKKFWAFPSGSGFPFQSFVRDLTKGFPLQSLTQGVRFAIANAKTSHVELDSISLAKEKAFQ